MDILGIRPTRRSGSLAPLSWILAVFDFLAAWLIIGLLSAMVAVVSAQVAMRYGLNSSIGWADEVSRLTFIWTMFLAIPLGIGAGAHIGIELLTDRLPAHLRQALQRLMALLAMGMMLIVAWETVKLAADQWDEMMSSLRYSSGWFLVPVAICGLHAALHFLWIVLAGPRVRDENLAQELA